RALENVPYKVVIDISSGPLAIYADAVLPAAPYLEKDGHYTDWEGRSQRLRPARDPHGLARSEWRIFQELSEAMGGDMGFRSLEALHEEMGRLLAPRSPDTPPSAADRQARPPADPEGTPDEDGESLSLFTYPLLVDEGSLSAGADTLKEALEAPPFVEVHPADAERLGLTEGVTATLRTSAGEAKLPVRTSRHIAEGAAFVPYNQPGFKANSILSGRMIMHVTLEAGGRGEDA
ncbi:MAG: molybdopterin-dependent oxidoreductase, partial [Actinobacteria bacterium]|nr:molybdopterin-dependent oxidoreductase [Actinomycetota bacterium]